MSDDYTQILWDIAKQYPYKRGASHVVPSKKFKVDEILKPVDKEFVPIVLKQIGSKNANS